MSENEAYFVFTSSEDGDHYLRVFEDRCALLQDIDELVEEEENFIENIPASNMAYWGSSTLIIKGRIVMPKPKEVTVAYDIE